MFGRIFAELQPPDAWGFQFAGPVVTWDAHITSSHGKRLIWISIASIEICGFSVPSRGPVRGVKYFYCLVVRLALRARRGSGLVPRNGFRGGAGPAHCELDSIHGDGRYFQFNPTAYKAMRYGPKFVRTQRNRVECEFSGCVSLRCLLLVCCSVAKDYSRLRGRRSSVV